MHRRTAALALAFVVVTTALATSAEAFDGRRQGFVLGFGAGYASLGSPHSHGDNSALATRFEIGAGIGDRWIVHYAGKQALDFGNSNAQFLPMVGVTHYLKSDAGGLLFTAGGGYSVLLEHGLEYSSSGASLFVGTGYEFAPHWNVEIDYVNTAVTTHTFLITVGGLAY